MLRAALEEARRRLASGEAARAAGMSRESATVVDELIQRGAFHELRKNLDLAAAPAADLDKALADVLAPIQDADLLVFVASAMWNVSLALEYVEPARLQLTPEQARVLSTRLRESAREAVRRAVQLDPAVGGRSAFVALATGGTDDVSAPSLVTARDPAEGPSIPRPVLQAAPIVRYNDATGSTGWGGGGSLAIAFDRDGRTLLPIFGVAYGTVRVSNADGTFAHSLVALQAGLLGRNGKVEVAGMIEACLYWSSVVSTTMPPQGASSGTLP